MLKLLGIGCKEKEELVKKRGANRTRR